MTATDIAKLTGDRRISVRTIFKYPIEIVDEQVVMVPAGAKPLHFDLQKVPRRPIEHFEGEPTLWLEVDDSATKVPLRLFVVGTGNPIPPNAVNYIGTVLMPPFVWHLYSEAT